MNDDTKKLINETAKPATKPSSSDKKTKRDEQSLEYMVGQLEQAKTDGDWTSVARLAREIGRAEKEKAEAEREALLAKVEVIRDQMRHAIEGAIDNVLADLSSEEIELVHGVWLRKDFASGDTDVRIRRPEEKRTRNKS